MSVINKNQLEPIGPNRTQSNPIGINGKSKTCLDLPQNLPPNTSKANLISAPSILILLYTLATLPL